MQYNYSGIFAEIFNNKNDNRLKSWLNQADFQLRIKSCDELAPYVTAEDVVLDIITGVLTGRINWDMKKVPNVSTFMHHQIKGWVSNLQKRELNRVILFTSYSECIPKPAVRDVEEIPGVTLQEILMEQDIMELRDMIRQRLEKDAVAYALFEEILSGIKNRSTGDEVRLSESELENEKKRIRSLLRELQNGLE
jgi:hypothetical protein